jgi:hypothetical protein
LFVWFFVCLFVSAGVLGLVGILACPHKRSWLNSKDKAITFYQGKIEFLTVAQLFSELHVEVLKVSKSAY